VSKPDLSTWLTKQEACQRLQVSPRTLHRMVQAGTIEQRRRTIPGRCPEPVHNPSDIDSAAAIKPHPMPPANGVSPGSQLQPAQPAALHPALVQTALLFERVIVPILEQNRDLMEKMNAMLDTVDRMLPSPAQTPATRPKLWLTAYEACSYSGLTEAALRRFARQGYIVRTRDKQGIKFNRVSLEHFGTRAHAAQLASLNASKAVSQ
jgi:hypothetical protein